MDLFKNWIFLDREQAEGILPGALVRGGASGYLIRKVSSSTYEYVTFEDASHYVGWLGCAGGEEWAFAAIRVTRDELLRSDEMAIPEPLLRRLDPVEAGVGIVFEEAKELGSGIEEADDEAWQDAWEEGAIKSALI